MIEVFVTQRHSEAEGICSFELTAVDGSPLPPYEPGAHIDVHLPNRLIRQYSLCPGSEQVGRYLIAVLLEPTSRGGSAAVHALQIGDRLHIGAPRNHFPLETGALRSVLLAGGIGITPLLSMTEHLAARGADFVLHYGARSAARMAFEERLHQESVAPHVHFHLDDGAPEQKLVLAEALGAVTPGTHIYVCGPGGFMDWVLQGAREAGWPEAQLHREYFAAPARAQDLDAEDGAFQIQIGRDGAIHTVPAERNVIEVLNEHGIEVPVSCEQGVCGTCVTRVLKGQPDHRDSYLTEQERAANDCFTPCCSRAHSQLLVLDL
ncbi:Phthalate dioxygenase reductase [Pseudomonas sp. ACN8]|uniref:PDR/VanB family oxidoreductase n=1 Tax=Pseudomonas sp. ACN8 TaxID=1920428 RepID=UPI000BB378D3|nr:PDR/VanB family oxidoreductase [Pseudomonas sp. ACN8]PBJ21478.1 Phthalate dioxygenase reductase [Pseudomonas sp. ACN8]